MVDKIVIRGRTEILIANPPTGTLHKLGESQDMVQESHQVFTHDVPGDRHGGPQGPPIEVQYLGEIINLQLDLSRWDEQQAAEIERRDVLVSPGSLPLDRVGMPLLLWKSWRVVLRHETIDPQTNQVTVSGRNFPCCIVPTPIAQNRGTKYSALNFAWQAHRAPEGHPFNGILYDDNITEGLGGSQPLP